VSSKKAPAYTATTGFLVGASTLASSFIRSFRITGCSILGDMCPRIPPVFAQLESKATNRNSNSSLTAFGVCNFK